MEKDSAPKTFTKLDLLSCVFAGAAIGILVAGWQDLKPGTAGHEFSIATLFLISALLPALSRKLNSIARPNP